MDNEQTEFLKKKKGGRNPKNNPVVFRFSVNFNAEEHAQFLTLFEQSGLQSKSRFIAARVFGDVFRVIKTDKAAIEYVTKLTYLLAQYRSIGVNYNQVTKVLNTNFSEKKALSMLLNLEKATFQLVEISQQIIALSQQFEKEWLPK